MTEVYRTIIAPLDKVSEVNDVGTNYEGYENMLRRDITTDSAGAPPATHKGGAGLMPEQLAADLISISGIFISNSYWSTALTEGGFYTVVEEI